MKFKIYTFLFWSVCFFLLSSLLNALLSFYYIKISGTNIPFDLSYFTRPMILVPFLAVGLIIPFLLCLLASRSRLASTIFAVIVSIIVLLTTFYRYSFYHAGFSEVTVVLGGIVEIVTMITLLSFVGFLSVLELSIFREQLRIGFKYILIRALIVCAALALFFASQASVISSNIKDVKESNSEFQALHATPYFKKFIPTYLPKGVGKLDSERSQETQKGTLMSGDPMQNSIFKNFSSFRYERIYIYSGDWQFARPVASFFLTETVATSSVSPQAFFSFDEAELKNQKTYLDSIGRGEELQYEVLSINSYPATYVKSYGTERLYYYPADSIRLEIYGTGYGTQQTYFPKDELIKTAQGLKEAPFQ